MNAARVVSTGRQPTSHRLQQVSRRTSGLDSRPVVAFRQRSAERNQARDEFNAPERWHEPLPVESRTSLWQPKVLLQPAGAGFRHAVTPDEVRARLAELPQHLVRDLDVIQFSGMTRKRRNSPCYGMQWGTAVYLYPIEANFIEQHANPPQPQQIIEAKMYGGVWSSRGKNWTLTWTEDAIRDFYLNNVLIHEIGHLNDPRNTNPAARERFANWFAIEYGYRASRGRIAVQRSSR